MIIILGILFGASVGEIALAALAMLSGYVIIGGIFKGTNSKILENRRELGQTNLPADYRQKNAGIIFQAVALAGYCVYHDQIAIAILMLLLPVLTIPRIMVAIPLIFLCFGANDIATAVTSFLLLAGIIAFVEWAMHRSLVRATDAERLQLFVQEIWPPTAREKVPQLGILKDKKKLNAFALSKRGRDKVYITERMSDWTDEQALKGVIAHEVRHADQLWMEFIRFLTLIGVLGLALAVGNIWAWAGFAALIILSWVGAWYAEVDADRWACKIVGGDAYARAMESLKNHHDWRGGGTVFDVHPRLDKRIRKAREFDRG